MSLFKCGKCNKIFTRKLHIENHISRKTNCIKSDYVMVYTNVDNPTLEINNTPCNINIHKCKYCNKTYSRNDSLVRHIRKNMCKAKRELPPELPDIKINEKYPINNQLIDIIVDKSKAIEELKNKYENDKKVNDISLVKNKEPSTLVLNDIVIIARPEDNFVNATELCRAGNKLFNDWYRLDKTKELIKELEKYENPETGNPVSANSQNYDLNNENIENIDTETNINTINSNRINNQNPETRIHTSAFVKIVKGGNDKNNQGTWIHPDLAIQLAQWISPKFALQVGKWIRTLFITGTVSLVESHHNELKLKDERIPGSSIPKSKIWEYY